MPLLRASSCSSTPTSAALHPLSHAAPTHPSCGSCPGMMWTIADGTTHPHAAVHAKPSLLRYNPGRFKKKVWRLQPHGDVSERPVRRSLASAVDRDPVSHDRTGRRL